jgi:hypothetical protein
LDNKFDKLGQKAVEGKLEGFATDTKDIWVYHNHKIELTRSWIVKTSPDTVTRKKFNPREIDPDEEVVFTIPGNISKHSAVTSPDESIVSSRVTMYFPPGPGLFRSLQLAYCCLKLTLIGLLAIKSLEYFQVFFSFVAQSAMHKRCIRNFLG